MPDMREEFESWLLREHGLESEWQDERNCFKDYPAHLAFKAWQASRAALRVELPEHRIGALSVDGQLRYVDGWNDYRERAKEELKQAGIEVKNG